MSFFHAQNAFDEFLTPQYLKPNSICVELGCWIGDSTAYACKLLQQLDRNIRWYAVDTWEGSPGVEEMAEQIKTINEQKATLFEIFFTNQQLKGDLRPLRILQTQTALAAKAFAMQSVDFVYVDADHSYVGCVRDIKAWYSKLKPGGIMLGDDFVPSSTHPLFQVEAAVRDAIGLEHIKLLDTEVKGMYLWLFQKPL